MSTRTTKLKKNRAVLEPTLFEPRATNKVISSIYYRLCNPIHFSVDPDLDRKLQEAIGPKRRRRARTYFLRGQQAIAELVRECLFQK